MRRAFQLGLVVAFAFAVAPVFAQDDLTEVFCEGLPKCSGDNLSVVFDATGTNTWNMPTFTPDTTIACKVFMSTTSTMVQGWSYSIVSDPAALTITDAALTLAGTDAQAAIDAAKAGGANVTSFITNKVVDGGIISAVVLDLFGAVILEAKPNSILALTYTLVSDVGAAGTVLRFADKEIGVQGSPPVEINITDNGRSLAPMMLTHGGITIGEGGGGCPDNPPEPGMEITCDDGEDNDCDGLIDDADPDCAPASTGCPEGTAANGLFFGQVGDAAWTVDGGSVAIISRNDADLLGFSFGVKAAVAGGSTSLSFSGELGNNDRDGNPVLVELNFTKSDGSAVEPAAGNTATAATVDPVNAVVRGSATAGFEADDFFAVDLAPELGGPGFFVGYVASLMGDISKVIPTTPSPEDSCPSNELVVASLGEITDVAFSRGDSNGDGKITVQDGILIIQNAAGNLQPVFDCAAANDADGNGTSDITDGVFLLNYIFKKNSPVPPAPFRACETQAGADCNVSNCAG